MLQQVALDDDEPAPITIDAGLLPLRALSKDDGSSRWPLRWLPVESPVARRGYPWALAQNLLPTIRSW